MTARPTEPSHGALSAEERELAARLRLDASAGPSSALDARILAAARAAAAPVAPPSSRRLRRWPGAVGAAAVLVAAVGLAWQLRPMFQLPPPAVPSEHADAGKGAGAAADTVVQVETVPRRETPVMSPAAPEAAAAPVAVLPPPAAARKAAPATAGGAPAQNRAPATAARMPSPHDFVDEAVPPPPPPPPPPPAAAPMPESRALSAAAPAPVAADAVDAAAGVAVQEAEPAARARRQVVAIPTPDVSADAHLSARDWLIRIRERRDAGDIAGARASLARFVTAHPRVAVPTDLRPLLHDGDPWSP